MTYYYTPKSRRKINKKYTVSLFVYVYTDSQSPTSQHVGLGPYRFSISCVNLAKFGQLDLGLRLINRNKKDKSYFPFFPLAQQQQRKYPVRGS